MKKRWKGITALLCLSVLALLWYEALTTLNEIIIISRMIKKQRTNKEISTLCGLHKQA